MQVTKLRPLLYNVTVYDGNNNKANTEQKQPSETLGGLVATPKTKLN